MTLPQESEEKLPFSTAWQKAFLHQVVEDDRLSELLAPHLKTSHFDNEVLQWMWATSAEHRRRYGSQPSWVALEESCRKLDPKTRELYQLGLEQIRATGGNDAAWVRTTAVEFVRRKVFEATFRDVRDIYNSGHFERAYSKLMSEMDRFRDIAVEDPAIESWHFEELGQRQARRFENQNHQTATGTGIPQLDQLLGGGLDLGQLGLMMAYSKVGKTSCLIAFGKVAARAYFRNVAHFYFEGSQEQISNRYDASFAAELYASVKRGEIGQEKYAILFQEYQFLRRKLYIRGFIDKWDYTVEDVWEALRRLKRREGWEPDVLIIDYADLLKGRGSFGNEYDSNAAAYRDLKTLSTKGRGYALWSAAQAKKPKDDSYDTKPHLLKAADLGGRYEKVKVADLLMSLNATLEERMVQGSMRIWVEAVRDAPAGVEIVVPIDPSRMLFGAGAGVQVQPQTSAAPPPVARPQGRQAVPYEQTRPGF